MIFFNLHAPLVITLLLYEIYNLQVQIAGRLRPIKGNVSSVLKLYEYLSCVRLLI